MLFRSSADTADARSGAGPSPDAENEDAEEGEVRGQDLLVVACSEPCQRSWNCTRRCARPEGHTGSCRCDKCCKELIPDEADPIRVPPLRIRQEQTHASAGVAENLERNILRVLESLRANMDSYRADLRLRVADFPTPPEPKCKELFPSPQIGRAHV